MLVSVGDWPTLGILVLFLCSFFCCCCCARLFATNHVLPYFLCALRLLSNLMKHMLRNVFEKEWVLTFNILWKIKSKPIATKGWPNTVHTQGTSIFFCIMVILYVRNKIMNHWISNDIRVCFVWGWSGLSSSHSSLLCLVCIWIEWVDSPSPHPLHANN